MGVGGSNPPRLAVAAIASGGGDIDQLIHHSDRGVQWLSVRYTERLAEAVIVPSVGSVGDSYDNALAEAIFGLFKTEAIRENGPWRSLEEVELATFEMGRLVQPPAASRADREHSPGRVRGALLRNERRVRLQGSDLINRVSDKTGAVQRPARFMRTVIRHVSSKRVALR